MPPLQERDPGEAAFATQLTPHPPTLQPLQPFPILHCTRDQGPVVLSLQIEVFNFIKACLRQAAPTQIKS